MDRGIQRIIQRRTVILTDRKVIVSANNANFPRVSGMMQARVMLNQNPPWQDIDPAAPFYHPTISKDASNV